MALPMTTGKQIGQTVHLSPSPIVYSQDPVRPPAAMRHAAKGRVGSVDNITPERAETQLPKAKLAVEKSRLQYSTCFRIGRIHGYAPIFSPVPLAMASTLDPRLVEMASRTRPRKTTNEASAGQYSANG